MSNRYRVVIKGARTGVASEAVIERLAQLFKMPAEAVRPRFLSGSFPVKKAVDLATAEQYRAFLEPYGCVCAIEPEATEPAPANATSPGAAPGAAPGPAAAPALAEVPAKPASATPAPATPAPARAAPAPTLAIAEAPATPTAPTLALAEAPAKPAADARRSVAERNGEPAYEPPADSTSFAVRFDLRQQLNRGAKKRHPLSGKGELTFTKHGLRIAGKRPRRFRFAAKEDFVIGYEDVMDARSLGKMVYFSAQGLGPERRDLCFAVANEGEADHLVSLLPRRQSDEFREFQNDERVFNDSLEEFGTVPIVSYALLAINILVFVLMVKKGVGLFFADIDLAIDFGTNYGPLTLSGQWWRLASACFIHMAVTTLIFNMLLLYRVGRMVEQLYGSLHFALLFAVAGLAANLSSLLWHPFVNAAGASGALFGVCGALLAYMLFGSNGVPRTIMEEHRHSILLFVGYSLYRGFFRAGIDNAAHIGGLLAGLAMGYLLMRPLNEEARKESAAPKLASSAAAAAVLLGVAGFFLAHQKESVMQDLNFMAQSRLINLAEAKAEDDYAELEAKVAAGSMTQAQMAEPIEKQILPQWQAISGKARAITLSDTSRFYEQSQDMLRDIEERQRNLQQAVRDARTDDVAALRRADDAERGIGDGFDTGQEPAADN